MTSDIEAIERDDGALRDNAVTARLDGSCPPDPSGAADQQLCVADEQSSEIESTCTIVAANTKNQADDDHIRGSEQILSAQRLAHISHDSANGFEANKSPGQSSDACLVELHLEPISSVPEQLSESLNRTEEERMFSPSAREDYEKSMASYNTQQPLQSTLGQTFRNAAECSPPKLSFSSWRMREYFNSFKGHSRDTKNLYQFFKSIRTELVACLLFALISSHSLIVCRSHLQATSPSHVNHETSSAQWTAGRIWPQLTSGLVVCLLVASLTQVFGHVSGCHLIPSVSLALFVKGHIGRARLASYLAAQAVGALLGIGLLALLTSSQVPGSTSLSSPSSLSSPLAPLLDDKSPISSQTLGPARPGHSGRFNLAQSVPIQLRQQQQRRRRKREADDDIDLNGIQGSETILLSIMEQQQQRAKSRTSEQEVGSQQKRLEATSPSATGQEKTITLSEPVVGTSSASSDSAGIYPPAPGGAERVNAYAASPKEERESFPSSPSLVAAAAAFTSESNSSGSNNNTASNDESRVLSASLAPTTIAKPSTASSNPRPTIVLPATTNAAIGPILLPAKTIEMASENFSFVEPAPTHASGGHPATIKRKLTKRNKQRQQYLVANSNAAAAELSNGGGGGGVETIISSDRDSGEPVTSNMLALGLPEPIMSADSIRQCSLNQPTRQLLLSNCLSLSNASQMFVFQLLACALVVLVYLVNVDPRRTDAGFKSLSIGFGHFVACAMTINSGGFYGNPFQLLALNWFSSSPAVEFLSAIPPGWRSEWWIYLIAPLVGGLFGAISHEYIDFTSLNNRDRSLHLRRSFHSICASPLSSSASVELGSQPRADAMNLATIQLALNAARPNPQLRHQQQAQHHEQKNRHRREGSESSASAVTASSESLSTNLDPTGYERQPEPQLQPRQQPRQQQQQQQQCRRDSDRADRKLEAASSSRYSRQLSQEQRRLRREQASQQPADCRPVAAARRASDFDANFLISSSSSSSFSPLQLPPPQTMSIVSGRHNSTAAAAAAASQRPLACCSRANQMMTTGTSVM